MNKQQAPVLFARVKKVNKNFITKMALKSGRTQNECVDIILDSIRLKKELNIETKKSKLVKKVEALAKKKKKKLAAL